MSEMHATIMPNLQASLKTAELHLGFGIFPRFGPLHGSDQNQVILSHTKFLIF